MQLCLKFSTTFSLALDGNHTSLLSLLYLSATFDTIDHLIHLSRVHHAFGISGTALELLVSVLRLWSDSRVVSSSVNGVSSDPAAVDVGVPQGLSTHHISEISIL